MEPGGEPGGKGKAALTGGGGGGEPCRRVCPEERVRGAVAGEGLPEGAGRGWPGCELGAEPEGRGGGRSWGAGQIR